MQSDGCYFLEMGISNLRAILKKCAGPKQDVSNIATLFFGGTVAGPDIGCKLVLVPRAKSIRGAAEECQSDPRMYSSITCGKPVSALSILGDYSDQLFTLSLYLIESLAIS